VAAPLVISGLPRAAREDSGRCGALLRRQALVCARILEVASAQAFLAAVPGGGQGALLGVCVTFPDTAGCGSIFAVLGAFLLQRIALQGGGNRDSTLPTLSRSSCSPVRTGTVGAAIWRMCDWNISMRLLRPREWCCARQNSTWRSVLASEIRCSVETLQITAPGITCTQAMCAGVPKVIGDLLQLVWQRERRKSWLHSLLTAVHIGDCRVITLNPKSAMQSD